MKILLDQNLSFRLEKRLYRLYGEVRHVTSLGLRNANDREIWEFAKKNAYTVFTQDDDFETLHTLYGHPPKIVWFRMGNVPNEEFINVLTDRFDRISQFINNVDAESGLLEVYRHLIVE